MMHPVLIELPMPIRTPRLLIRNPKPGDGIELSSTIQDSFNELNAWMPWADKVPTAEEAEINVRQAYSQWILREDLRLPIFDPTGKTMLGSTGLHRMNWQVPAFEIGFWARSTQTGKGFITEAVNAVTRYAFNHLKAKRVEIRCDSENGRSKKIIDSLGFSLEGTLHSDALKPGQQGIRDTLVFARLNLDGLPDLEVSWR
jgi:RimJ/RimL family protein N-acetyltransferase